MSEEAKQAYLDQGRLPLPHVGPPDDIEKNRAAINLALLEPQLEKAKAAVASALGGSWGAVSENGRLRPGGLATTGGAPAAGGG